MLSRLLHKIHKKAWSIVPLGASVAAPAALALKSQQEEPEKELLSVFWIIRHGWRTPISIRTFGYMKDLDWECYTADETLEFRNNHLILHRGGQILDTFQPVFRSELEHNFGRGCHRGQLTLLGQKQVHDVGVKAKELYSEKYKFLTEDIDKELYIRSTNSGRTLETAFQFVRGLYNSVVDLDRSKIKVHLHEYEKETMYPRSSNCPLIEQQTRWRRKYVKTKEYKDAVSKILDPSKFESLEVFDRIARTPFGELCNNLSLLRAHSFPMPQGVESHHVDEICELSGKMFSETSTTPELLRVSIGEFLGEIVDTLKTKALVHQNKMTPQDHSKLVVAAGHDTTLAPLLLSLGVFDGHHPPMASSLGVELWKDKNIQLQSKDKEFEGYYIKLMYNFKDMPIPACDNKIYCPFDEFLELTKGKVPKDYTEECKVQVE